MLKAFMVVFKVIPMPSSTIIYLRPTMMLAIIAKIEVKVNGSNITSKLY